MRLSLKNPLDLALNCVFNASITHGIVLRQFVYLLTFLVFAFNTPVFASTGNTDVELEQFKTAWEAAKKGNHASFNQIRNSLQGYVLAPYLQYEDYRNRRHAVPVD